MANTATPKRRRTADPLDGNQPPELYPTSPRFEVLVRNPLGREAVWRTDSATAEAALAEVGADLAHGWTAVAAEPYGSDSGIGTSRYRSA